MDAARLSQMPQGGNMPGTTTRPANAQFSQVNSEIWMRLHTLQPTLQNEWQKAVHLGSRVPFVAQLFMMLQIIYPTRPRPDILKFAIDWEHSALMSAPNKAAYEESCKRKLAETTAQRAQALQAKQNQVMQQNAQGQLQHTQQAQLQAQMQRQAQLALFQQQQQQQQQSQHAQPGQMQQPNPQNVAMMQHAQQQFHQQNRPQNMAQMQQQQQHQQAMLFNNQANGMMQQSMPNLGNQQGPQMFGGQKPNMKQPQPVQNGMMPNRMDPAMLNNQGNGANPMFQNNIAAAQTRPGRLSVQDMQKVNELAHRLMATASATEKASIDTMLSRASEQQRAHWAQQNVNPMLEYFRRKAYNQLLSSSAQRINGQQAGGNPQGAAQATGPNATQNMMVNNAGAGQGPPSGKQNTDTPELRKEILGIQQEGLRSQQQGQVVVPISQNPQLTRNEQPGFAGSQSIENQQQQAQRPNQSQLPNGMNQNRLFGEVQPGSQPPQGGSNLLQQKTAGQLLEQAKRMRAGQALNNNRKAAEPTGMPQPEFNMPGAQAGLSNGMSNGLPMNNNRSMEALQAHIKTLPEPERAAFIARFRAQQLATNQNAQMSASQTPNPPSQGQNRPTNMNMPSQAAPAGMPTGSTDSAQMKPSPSFPNQSEKPQQIILTAEQRAMMDNINFPRQLFTSPNSQLPPQITTWGQLKLYLGQRNQNPQVIQRVLHIQAQHFQSLSKQSQSAAERQAQLAAMNGQKDSDNPMVRPQMNQSAQRNSGINDRQFSTEDMHAFRQKVPEVRTYTDDMLRTFMTQRLQQQQRQQMLQQQQPQGPIAAPTQTSRGASSMPNPTQPVFHQETQSQAKMNTAQPQKPIANNLKSGKTGPPSQNASQQESKIGNKQTQQQQNGQNGPGGEIPASNAAMADREKEILYRKTLQLKALFDEVNRDFMTKKQNAPAINIDEPKKKEVRAFLEAIKPMLQRSKEIVQRFYLHINSDPMTVKQLIFVQLAIFDQLRRQSLQIGYSMTLEQLKGAAGTLKQAATVGMPTKSNAQPSGSQTAASANAPPTMNNSSQTQPPPTAPTTGVKRTITKQEDIPPAPTSDKPPFSFAGSNPTPQGVPQYSGPSPITIDKLKVPAHKKRKSMAENAAPMVADIKTKPAQSAPVEVLRCPAKDCPKAEEIFDSRESLWRHSQTTHLDYAKDDSLELLEKSMSKLFAEPDRKPTSATGSAGDEICEDWIQLNYNFSDLQAAIPRLQFTWDHDVELQRKLEKSMQLNKDVSSIKPGNLVVSSDPPSLEADDNSYPNSPHFQEPVFDFFPDESLFNDDWIVVDTQDSSLPNPKRQKRQAEFVFDHEMYQFDLSGLIQ